MQAILTRIAAFIMAILSFFGIGAPKTDEPFSYAVKGKTVEICLAANPTTGYAWTAVQEGDSVTLTRDYSVQDAGAQNIAGAGGLQYYDCKAVKEGRTTITFTYARSWEKTDSDLTYVAVIDVAADGTVKVTEFAER